MINGKRGLEMAISTIILIVLGVLILIGLIYLLNNQFGFFSGSLKNVQTSDVDSIVNVCNGLVSSQATYSFCCEKKQFKVQGQNINLSCNELRNQSYIRGRISSLSCDVNCWLKQKHL